MLAFHISNRYLDLEPALADLAQDAGLASRHWEDWNISAEDAANGKETSHWVVMARDEGDLGPLLRAVHWLRLEGHSPPEIWSDDFSNLLGVFKWR